MALDIHDILAVYSRKLTIKGTAKATGISEQTVRKVLISNGIVPPGNATRIHDALASGKSVEQVAHELHLSPEAVSAYLPYERTPYFVGAENKTPNARKIAEWRLNTKKEATGKCP